MHDHGRDADLLEGTGQGRRGQRLVVPPQPHLDRHRNVHGIDHRGDQIDGPIGLAHQGRAAARLDHLVDRAAHVDIDGRRPVVDDPPGGLLHLGDDDPVDLDRQRAILLAGLGQLEGPPPLSIIDRALTRSVVARPSPPHSRTASRNARLV